MGLLTDSSQKGISKTAKRSMQLLAAGRINSFCANLTFNTQEKVINLKTPKYHLDTADHADKLNADLVVWFSTPADWKGEGFGFDGIPLRDNTKLRVGRYYKSDNKSLVYRSGHQADYVFKKNNGLPGNQGDLRLLYLEYRTIRIEDPSKGKSYPYHVPWLSLMAGAKGAKLIMNIEGRKPGHYLRFDANEHFEFIPNQIDDPHPGQREIYIRCKKEFPVDQPIVIRSYKKSSDENRQFRQIVGKINAWANAHKLPRELNILLVNVINKGVSRPTDETEKKRLEMTLKHFQLIPIIKEAELDLSGYVEANEAFFRDHNGRKKVVFSPDITVEEALESYQPKDTSLAAYNRRIESMLLHYLNQQSVQNITHSLPVFVFGYETMAEGIAGYYEPVRKVILLFGNRDETTLSHETLHALGLQHTFDNPSYAGRRNILFTYEYRKTKNIMDYSQGLETLHWQWLAVRRNRERLANTVPQEVAVPNEPIST